MQYLHVLAQLQGGVTSVPGEMGGIHDDRSLSQFPDQFPLGIWFVKNPKLVFTLIQTWFISVTIINHVWFSIGNKQFSSVKVYTLFIRSVLTLVKGDTFSSLFYM